MKYKSEKSNATDIPMEVKRIVYQRDEGKCVACLKNNGVPNAHYIRRSQNGLGIEQNVVCLCVKCHEDYDNGFKRKEIGNIIKNYLKSIYGDSWNEKDLVYDKWKNFRY